MMNTAIQDSRWQRTVAAVRDNPRRWWATTLGVVALYYGALLLGAMLRFGNLPNHVETYDWIGNVTRIFASTPSLRDALSIASDEWLLEVGYMNYDFGHGISEWALFLLPGKMLAMLALGALLATVLALTGERRCPVAGARTALGLGGGCVALSSITLTWVVCCSTPSWVVGLAMMGLSVSTSLWLEPLGSWLGLLGFAAQGVALFIAAGPTAERRTATPPHLPVCSPAEVIGK